MARMEQFLKQYSRSSTRSSYYSSVVAFLSFIYGFNREGKRITDDEKKTIENLSERYFVEDRDYEQDLINFSNYCDVKKAPTTKSSYIAAVREFYIFNGVELTKKQERNLKNKISRGGPVSEEEDLTKEKIRMILNASDLKLKTLIMFMITSGVRLGEAITLTLNDVRIDPTGEYGVISLKGQRKSGVGTKNIHSRKTFINKEAVELLNQWLQVREKYIDYIIGRSRGRFRVKTAKSDNRVFPFGKNNAENIIKTALKNAGVFKKDEDTGRSTIHFHLFRKYFVTNLTYGGVSDKYVDFFTGHIDALDRSYNKPTTEKLLEIYMKGEPYLRIFDESALEIAKTREEIKDTKDKVRDMQIENLVMKSKLQDFERVQARLKEVEQKLMAINSLDKMQGLLTPEDHTAIAEKIIALQKDPGKR
ncbi:MAG: tyrosine-type recombinase/integrase [Methanoregula sp.]|nr:MAG: tyrosine-type recombinase/integrase [Methanoregula sp.]